MQSRQLLDSGEVLTRNTPLPIDKETARPLADVIFPDEMPAVAPHFEEPLATAARALAQEWRSASALLEMQVEPARTCLIYGPPGTGKTTLALWLSGQLGLPAVVARLDGLISSFLGTTARNVGNLFAFASRYRCVLILDEFDAVAKVRDDPHEVGEIKRVVNALLQNMDIRRGNGLTIAVTNHEALLDPAIWRRFEIQLCVPRPGYAGRLAIL
ncbi:MAG: AAA family ATPase, partial [Burkholderiales bacterium]